MTAVPTCPTSADHTHGPVIPAPRTRPTIEGGRLRLEGWQSGVWAIEP